MRCFNHYRLNWMSLPACVMPMSSSCLSVPPSWWSAMQPISKLVWVTHYTFALFTSIFMISSGNTGMCIASKRSVISLSNLNWAAGLVCYFDDSYNYNSFAVRRKGSMLVVVLRLQVVVVDFKAYMCATLGSALSLMVSQATLTWCLSCLILPYVSESLSTLQIWYVLDLPILSLYCLILCLRWIS